MQDRVSEKQSPKNKFAQRVWFWILIGLVPLVVIFFIMLPVGVDYGIKRYIKDQGADQVSLEDVDFNPVTGRMTLKNLSVTIGTQTVLQIPEATLEIEWTPFVRKRIVLERFTISDTELIVKELPESNWQIGGITFPRTKETTEPSSWNFGLQQITIENSSIKFASSKVASEVKIEHAKISKLTSWLPESSARLEFKGQLNGSNLNLQVDVAPFGNEITASGRIELKGLALDPFAPLLQPHLQTLEGRLDIDANMETRRTGGGGFNHHQKGSVKLYQIRAQMADMNLGKDVMIWDGAMRVSIPGSQETMKIIADGQLNGSGLNLGIENENLKVQQDNFSWKGKINYTQDNTQQKIQTDGRISLFDLKLESPDLHLSEEKLTWLGPLQFFSSANTEGQRIIADGVLDGNNLRVNLPGRMLKFEHQGLSWKGRLDTGRTNDFSALQTEATVNLKNIEILHSKTNQRLLNSERIELQAIQVQGLDKISISGIGLNELALLADPKYEQSSAADYFPLRIQEIKIKNTRLSQQHNLAIDSINLNSVRAFVLRDPKGKWPAVDRLKSIQNELLSADQRQPAMTDTQTKEKSSEFGFRIGTVVVTGESGLRFKDDSVTPAFGMDFSILEARLAGIDSSQPQQPLTVHLLLSDEDNARLALDGTVIPFAEKLSLDWVGKIEALELPPLSPYVIDSTGYRFTSGELAADVPLKIDQNKLKGAIDLVLYNPKIKRTETAYSEKQQKGKIQLNMSLPSALKLLSDKQNNVQLNIPISGNIDDPQFSVADAINKVLAKTLQTAAVSTLKYMLGPYGIGISVAQLAYEQALKIRLNPIQFAPGSDALDEAAIDYLQRVAAILKEYPTAQVSVCGVATESDRKAMNKNTSTDTALMALARKRTDSIEDYLVNSNRIEAKRIIACEPEIDTTAEAKPRANLEI